MMDKKSAQDLTTKHFSKFGEFLVSFELSFFKDQDRQHFSSKNFGKWVEFFNKFDKLD